MKHAALVALTAVAAAAAAVAPAAAADGAAAARVGVDAGGGQHPSGKKAKRSVARLVPKQDDGPSIPQVPGEGPIVAPHSYLQLPARTEPRSLAFAPRRRAVLVTDGAIYQKAVPGLLPFMAPKKEAAVPYAYILDGASGRCTFNMGFFGRRALPYGIAEDPRDGRVAVTFYQSQKDSIEVWSPDLSVKLTYHDVSLKP